MRKIRFNKGWEFNFENNIDEFTTFGFDKYSDAAGAAARFYDYSNWERIDLPHDWSLSLERTTEAPAPSLYLSKPNVVNSSSLFSKVNSHPL